MSYLGYNFNQDLNDLVDPDGLMLDKLYVLALNVNILYGG